MIRFRIVAYQVHGKRIGVLPTQTWRVNQVLNGTPVLRLQWAASDEPPAGITYSSELALEYTLDGGGTWTEPPNARFIQPKLWSDLADRATVKGEAIGYAHVLSHATVYEATPKNEDGKREFKARTAGYILGTLISEALARRSANNLQWTNGALNAPLSGTFDSASKRWDQAAGLKYATVEFDPSTPLTRVVEWLTRKGLIDWQFQGREFRAYIADTVLGRRRNDVRLREAFSTAVPVTVASDNIVTDGIFQGDEGFRRERALGEPVRAFGRIERWTQQGQVGTDATANLYLDELLKPGRRPQVQYRRDWAASDDAPMPFINYQLGDWVRIDTHELDDDEHLRVVELTVECDADGKIHGSDTLGTRLENMMERLARRTWDLTAGRVGSDSGTPKPPPKSLEAPTAVLATGTATWVGGEPHGIASVSWSHPGADRFEVWRQFPAKDLVWRVATTTSGMNADIGSLAVGGTYNFKVRAADVTGRVGEFSKAVQVTIPLDDEPPPKPSVPILSQDFLLLCVQWDGKMALGQAPPADFSHLEVEVFDRAAAKVISDNLVIRPPTLMALQSVEHGVEYQVRLRAVDFAGNKSAWSTAATITVVDPIAKPLDEAKKYADAQKAELDSRLDVAWGRLTDVEAAAAEAHNGVVQAQQAALEAANIAASKGNILYATTAPTSAGARSPNTLWIKLPEYHPHRWDGSKWVQITDKAVVEAAAAAAEAHTEAIKAQQAAAAAQADATAAGYSADSALQAASAAQQDANAAMVQANIAVTSADGKNTIRYFTYPPPNSAEGTTPGDIWWQIHPETGNVLGYWRSDGVAWVPCLLTDAVIANLDVGKLTAGTARIADAVVNKLFAEVVTAKRIAADQVIISRDGNLLVDPKFEDDRLNAWRRATGVRVAKTVVGLHAELRPVAGTHAQLRMLEMNQTLDGVRPIPITPGKYVFSADVNSGYGENQVWAWLRLHKRDGTIEEITSPAITTPKGWTWLSRQFDVTADVESVEPIVVARHTDGTPVVWVRNLWLKPQIGNALIVNGGILADSLNTKQIWANKAWFGEANAKIVRADMFEGKSFTGGTFTGPLIQTDAEVNTGVKLTPEGLVAYNSWGQKNFTLDAATGNAKFVGRYQSGRDGEAGIAIIPPSEASYRDTGIFWSLDASTISSPTPGFWINKFGTATNQPVIMRGRGDSGLHIIGGLTVQMDDVSLGGSARFRLNGLPNASQSANLFVDHGGMVYKVSSARRYKAAIEKVPDAACENLLRLQPSSWIDRGQLDQHMAANAALARGEQVPEELEPYTEMPPRVVGLIAEDVDKAGLTDLVTYTRSGTVEGVQYDRIAPMLIPIIRGQRDRIEQLEERLARIEARLAIPEGGNNEPVI